MTDPVLTADELARLLKTTSATVSLLLERTDLPRALLLGEPRFVTAQVLHWLGARATARPKELVPDEPPALPPTPPAARVQLAPAVFGEHPWVPSEALAALVEGPADAARNLDRLKLRDALLELNDALLPALTRLSSGRLHPHHDEKLRTSPWRIDLDSEAQIRDLRMAWGEGPDAPPHFADRPHLEVALAAAELRVALVAGHRASVHVADAVRDELTALGFVVGDEAIAKTYAMPSPAPTLHGALVAVERDFERLVPRWLELVGPR